jgi:hypothetical protein
MDTIELHAPTSSTKNNIDMDTIELRARLIQPDTE